MSPQDIERIERELQIALPIDYKKTMLSFPVRRDRGNDDSPLFDNSDALIDLNRKYREGFAGLPRWPVHYYLIGDDGAASCYLLDLTKTPSPVLLADHGNIERLSREADTLKFFVAGYIATFKEAGINPDAPRRPLTLTKVLSLAMIVGVTAAIIGYLVGTILLRP
jgi:hypothetical protein